MPHVCLRAAWPGSFSRTIPGSRKGDSGITYTFQRGLSVELSKREVDWLRKNGDIGVALEVVTSGSPAAPAPAAEEALTPEAVSEEQ